MNKYKLQNTLWYTEAKLFESDEEAWNTLRLELPNKYATLFKQVEMEVPYNNSIEYTSLWNSKYASKIDSNIKNIDYVWIPILEGITSHEYKID